MALLGGTIIKHQYIDNVWYVYYWCDVVLQ